MRKPLKNFLFINLPHILPVVMLLMTSCTSVAVPSVKSSKCDRFIDSHADAPSAKHRAKHIMNNDNSFEWWYFDGRLDSGETFVGVFYDPHPLTGKPKADLWLYDKDWKKEIFSSSLNPEDMTASDKDVDITCPAGYVHRPDEKTYLAGWSFKDIKADFRLTTLAPGWKPGDGDKNLNGQSDFLWAIHQGRNSITGTITKNGVTRNVSGVGYADHNWGTKKIYEVARSWIWGRIFADKYTIIFTSTDLKDISAFAQPFYIARDNTMIVSSGSPVIKQTEFITHDLSKRHYPCDISIDYTHAGITAHISIKHRKLIEYRDLLNESGYNSFVQWVARTFIARPGYFRIAADYEGSITENGRRSDIKGECLYEIMDFE